MVVSRIPRQIIHIVPHDYFVDLIFSEQHECSNTNVCYIADELIIYELKKTIAFHVDQLTFCAGIFVVVVVAVAVSCGDDADIPVHVQIAYIYSP